jgi:O-antigen/teichoic acid export membrane protein
MPRPLMRNPRSPMKPNMDGHSQVLRRVSSWFKDDVFRRLFLNAGKLLSANMVAAALELLGVVLTARALGAEQYGILALVLAYQLTIRALVAFEAWQAIVKFGCEALQANDRPALRQLIKFAFTIDIASALAGVTIAMAAAGPVIQLLGWDQSVRPLLLLYSVLILFSLNGTPIGVLRLFDRFDLLSYTPLFKALVRLAGVAWCFVTAQGLVSFVVVYLVTGIVAQAYQIFAALWVLRQQGVNDVMRQPLGGIRRTFPGIWDYVWTTNLTMTIRLLSREADTLVIAGLTTPAALGLFRVAKQFSSVLPRFSDPLSQSIYPELARAWADRDRNQFLALIKRSTLFTSAVAFLGWIAFILAGHWIIQFTVGSRHSGMPIGLPCSTCLRWLSFFVASLSPPRCLRSAWLASLCSPT